MPYNEIIHNSRTKRNLSQQDIADAICVSRRTVIAWEHGEKLPSFDCIIALAVFFEISTDYLLGLTTDPTPPGKPNPNKE